MAGNNYGMKVLYMIDRCQFKVQNLNTIHYMNITLHTHIHAHKLLATQDRDKS